MEHKVFIRLTAEGFDKQVSMGSNHYDAMEVDPSQLSRDYLHEACDRMRATLEDKGNISVHRVTAVAVTAINGMLLTSSKVVEKYI